MPTLCRMRHVRHPSLVRTVVFLPFLSVACLFLAVPDAELVAERGGCLSRELVTIILLQHEREGDPLGNRSEPEGILD